MTPLLLVFLVSVAVLLFVSFCMLGLSLKNSRPGYQDATGFHEGDPSDLAEEVTPIRVRTAPRVEDTFRGVEIRPVLVGCSREVDHDGRSVSHSAGLISAA